MAEFVFTTDHSRTQAAHVIDVLRAPRLWIPTGTDYPHHDEWLQKVEAELDAGKKRAMLASDGGLPIGVVVYQRNPDDSANLEVRNISIEPTYGGRYVGSFALRNAEIIGQSEFPGTSSVTVDTKVSNDTMVGFLVSHGYEIKDVTDLYGTDTGLDVVMRKELTTEVSQ